MKTPKKPPPAPVDAPSPPAAREPGRPSLRTALGLHEALRRLGVPSSCIYISPDTEAGVLAVVAVPVSGTPLALAAGPLRAGEVDALVVEWRAAVRWWNEGDDSDPAKVRLWQAFQLHFDPVPLILHVNARSWGELT